MRSRRLLIHVIICLWRCRYPRLLEMQLDVLYSQLASPPVAANSPTLAHRIADKEIPYGADIIVGIHARLLKEHHRLPPEEVAPTSLTGPSK